MTGEFGNTIRYASLEAYNAGLNSRVREPEMSTSVTYPYMARLLWSHFGDAAEFQARLTKLDSLENELGRASLELCVFVADPSEPLLVMEAETENGIIIPTNQDYRIPHGQSRRISHPQAGHIGSLGLGYLRAAEPLPAQQSTFEPEVLQQRVSLEVGQYE